ncbi:hypothetical protein [Lactobacillus delbrueckii]|uniref:hypothetical protein n=1 Tax=Lactobacillus delbrueckii TaxID=1584 RepID=UPI000A466E6B|nr:hypothetical protein [Lactobacillus delbrueckii]
MVKVTAAKGTLTFGSNDGSGRRQKKIFTLGKKVTLPKTGFDRKGYKFLNYTVATNGKGKKYRLGKAYTFKKSTTLWASTASWEITLFKLLPTRALEKISLCMSSKATKLPCQRQDSVNLATFSIPLTLKRMGVAKSMIWGLAIP